MTLYSPDTQAVEGQDMNRRDAALIAHLDAIEGRILDAVRDLGTEVRAELRLLREDIAGIKMELATHRHDDD